MKLKYLTCPSEVKLMNEIEGIVEGYASVYGNVDNGQDRVVKGAFSKTLRENKDRFRYMYNHREVIGVLTKVSSDDHGLLYQGKLNDRGKGDELRGLLKIGAKFENSFGYDTIKFKWDGNVRDLMELRLWEISMVDWGMNDLSKITAVKQRIAENKYIDFATALQNRELASAPWRMCSEMTNAIESILMDMTIDEQTKYALIQDSLTQFTDAFSQWCDDAMSAGMMKSAEMAQEMKKFRTSLEIKQEPDASTPLVLPADIQARVIDAATEMGNRINKLMEV